VQVGQSGRKLIGQRLSICCLASRSGVSRVSGLCQHPRMHLKELAAVVVAVQTVLNEVLTCVRRLSAPKFDLKLAQSRKYEGYINVRSGSLSDHRSGMVQIVRALTIPQETASMPFGFASWSTYVVVMHTLPDVGGSEGALRASAMVVVYPQIRLDCHQRPLPARSTRDRNVHQAMFQLSPRVG